MLLSEAVSLFLSTKKFEDFSPFTINSYGIHYRQLQRKIGDIDIQEITLQMLREHIAEEKERGLKTSSIGAKVRSLKSLFAWLTDEEYLEKNPTKKIHEPKSEKRIPKALTIEEVELLRDSCQTPLEHALIEFFFATGCRIGEVFGIDRKSVNFEKNSVQVMGKGQRMREVYFGARAAIWIKRYLESRKDEDPALFVTVNAPHRLQIHRMRVIMQTVAERCGLKEKFYPHVLRHTFATSILNNGAPLHTVQDLMGHQKPETTLLYTSVSGAARKQAYDKYFMQ